jgi:hypothetical protein
MSSPVTTPITPTNPGVLGDAAAVRVALVASLVSLFLSGWVFLTSLDDADAQRDLQSRLACLELPGANDCGPDAAR